MPLVCGWVLFAFWTFLLLPLWIIVGRWRLKSLALRLPAPAEWPAVAIVVPARDEAAMIEEALRSLLSLDYPQLEIIAVDDRSQDATGAVMDRLAAEDARLKVVHVTELPAGWLGKNYAMHRGAAVARAPWLLFTDGDVVFAPETVRLAMKCVAARRLDHLCMNPGLVPGTYWENALTVCFGLIFFAGFLAWLVPTRWKGAYCGIGAFNLVRTSVYREVGGFERLRLDVLDDVKLGKLIKHSGFRQQLLVGEDLIRVRWQHSFWGVVRGLEKNSFAALHYSVRELVTTTAILLVVFLTPYAGLALLPGQAAWGYVGSLVVLHATYAFLAVRANVGARVAPVLPAMLLMFIYVMWRSAVVTLKQGGVRWRDTLYPLDELRRNQFR
ncbi:MAG: glycosyltransferase [Planctomycetia bacterium]|nr:glycosyltransferase [Planctomycetia bacterium]